MSYSGVFTYREPERPIDPPRQKSPVCPVCGEECDTLYRRHSMTSSEIVGCDICIDALDAQEEMYERDL